MNARLAKRALWPMLLLLMACQPSVDLDEPPQIIYGQDVCDQCGMIINEQRFAASYVTVTGDVRRFDDIGGMLTYDHEANEEVHIYWVHDFNNEEWIDAGQAMFVLNRGLVTPMGWGVAAFSDMDGAEAYVAEHGGTIATFAELQEEINTGSLDPEAFVDEDHEHDPEMADD
jgi:copper chaperone NosL